MKINKCTCERPDDNTCEYCEKQQEQSILEEAKNKYMQELFYKSQLLSNTVIGLNPTIGYKIRVEGIDISERFFKEEFDEITKAYFSVIKKIQEYKKK
jgi:hypothetical protein